MKLQLLDELIALGHGSERSTDCIIAVASSGLPAPDIERAQRIFPKSASFPCEMGSSETLQAFLDVRLPTPFHIEVARINEEEPLIALKMSHVLGDAVSMFLFMKAMFGQAVEDGIPELKSFPAKKDTPYRDLLNSRLWPRRGEKSFERKFVTESLEHGDQNAAVFNDLMLYSLLETLPYPRKAIWVPVNVRKNFWKGFGNGLSRLRIYPPKGANLPEKLAHIRKQKQEAMKNGEVALPPADFDIHNKKHKFLYEMWIRRPWADWGSISLSHVTNSGGFLDGFRHVTGISNLMPAHNGAIFAVTSAGRTTFTLTFDPKIVSDEESHILLRDFVTHLRAKL
jgi:hypothetical protein